MIKGCSSAPSRRGGIVYVGAVSSSYWLDEAMVLCSALQSVPYLVTAMF